MLETPVALFIFRRPDVTARVFDAIAAAKPRQLLIVSDGPRPEKDGEAKLVTQTRNIVDRIDWDCEVQRRYLDENMGCVLCVSSGLDWVFSQVEQAIILEDDCIPDPSFFTFCSELLTRYESNPEVMAISGDHFFGETRFSEDSYYFSKHFHGWGWATWRRAWECYDHQMSDYESFQKNTLRGLCASKREFNYFRGIFNSVLRGDVQAWDYRFFYSIMRRSGACILPHQNLVSNAGDAEGGTNCRSDPDFKMNWIFNIPTVPFGKLKHPKEIVRNLESEQHWDSVFVPRKRLSDYTSLDAWQRRGRKFRRSIEKRLPSNNRAA